MYLSMFLVCISLMAKDIDSCAHLSPYILFGEVSLQVLCPFFIVTCFLIVELESSVYILDTSPWLDL